MRRSIAPASAYNPLAFWARNGDRNNLGERYFQHTVDNGLTLLAEKMPGMQSAAMTLLLPAGSSTDPVDRLGSATVLSDLVLRGAGSRDSRQLTADSVAPR